MNKWIEPDRIPDDLAHSLLSITPSVHINMQIWPCEFTLKDGSVSPRVLVFLSPKYYHDSEDIIMARDVAEIRESPHRLPAIWSNHLYSQGESGMDYFMYRVHYEDGSHSDVITPSYVDYPEWPQGKTNEDISKVESHKQFTQPFDSGDKKRAKFKRCYFRKENA